MKNDDFEERNELDSFQQYFAYNNSLFLFET